MERIDERLARVDAARINSEAGILLGEPPGLARHAQLVSRYIHQVGGVPAIEDGKPRIEAEVVGITPEQAICDGVKRAGPRQHALRSPGAVHSGQCLADDGLDTPRHLLRRAAREGQQQDAFRADTLDDQVGNPVRQGHRLAGSRAGNDQQRTRAERGAGRFLPE